MFSFLFGCKSRQELLAGHPVGVVGKIVIRRLVIDEDFFGEMKTFRLGKSLHRNDRHSIMDTAPEQRRTALRAEAAFAPLRRRIGREGSFVFDFDRSAAVDGHESTTRPTPAHAAMA